MHRRQLKRVLLLAVFLAPELDAQLPPAPQKTPGVREESSDDPFGRSTPRELREFSVEQGEVVHRVPPAPQKTPGVREESSDDPFGRSTPRGTVEGFIRAAEA